MGSGAICRPYGHRLSANSTRLAEVTQRHANDLRPKFDEQLQPVRATYGGRDKLLNNRPKLLGWFGKLAPIGSGQSAKITGQRSMARISQARSSRYFLGIHGL
jgi:hypothetical protein